MVKVKGASVYPSEVEAALHAVPGVRRAVVVDLPVGDTVELGAAVVLDAGVTVTPDDLDREARTRLSAFKVPARWAVIDADAVPTTPTGKVDKPRLQRLFEAGR
jgi:acyl-CoA synthetase (AMP-forming)/AMP-acid ligase II